MIAELVAWVIAIVVVVVVVFVGVARAHDDHQVTDWLDTHTAAVEAYPKHAAKLEAARLDFYQRHRIVSATAEWCDLPVDRVRTSGCRVWTVEYLPPLITTTTVAAAVPAAQVEAPAAPSRGMGSGVEQWRPLVETHFGANTDRALRVMACESGGNPDARNPSGASGLFQFMPFWWQGKWDPFDPARNIAEAAQLSNGGTDWSHWTCKG